MKLLRSALITGLALGGRLPLVPRFSMAAPQTCFYKIRHKKVVLAIDGGGLRGIISASVLKRVEKSIQYQTQNPSRLIGQSFDMIAGTSTGGILAAYFAVPSLNGTADGALSFYDKYAKKIFGGGEKTEPWKSFDWARLVIHTTKRLLHVGRRSPGWFGIVRRCIEGLPRHSGSGLDEVLSETLPSMTFSNLTHMPGSSGGRNASLFLVSYDVRYRRPVAFVADRHAKKTFFLRQEAISVPFSPPYQPKSAFARNFPGDENRCMSVVRRWIERFNQTHHSGDFYDEHDCKRGFQFGPITFLGDVHILRDEVVDDWQQLETNVIKQLEKRKNAPINVGNNFICYAKTNIDDLEVWKAVRASSSAPTYLPPMEIEKFYRRGWDNSASYCDNETKLESGFFCDGGIVANNPGLQALLYLMARDQAEDDDIGTENVPKEDAEYNVDKEIGINESKLQDWDDYNYCVRRTPLLDSYALLSIGSGSSFGNINVDSFGGSECSWLKQGTQMASLISNLMDNLQMVEHSNLRNLFALAGRENAYLRIQYIAHDNGLLPEHFHKSLGKMDDPNDSTLEDYKQLGEYIADVYAGTIDQFVFLHILKEEERNAFVEQKKDIAKLVFNGIAIPEEELVSFGLSSSCNILSPGRIVLQRSSAWRRLFLFVCQLTGHLFLFGCLLSVWAVIFYG